MNNVTFREYRKSDAPCLENVVRKTWKYDMYFTERTSRLTAGAYLASCLSEQTFNRVALINDKPVGIIMAKSPSKQKLLFAHFWNALKNIALLAINKDGRKSLNMYKHINSVDSKLLKEGLKKYDGELVFFVLDEDCRGRGIGKSLFHFAIDYFRNENLKNFYLYTDTTCNYGFYEHNGLTRKGEKNFKIPEKYNKSGTMSFYLYEGEI